MGGHWALVLHLASLVVVEAIALRLYGGNTDAGKVEVQFNGEWTSVCALSWGQLEAEVACSQLGYPRVVGHGVWQLKDTVGARVDVVCRGSEDSIAGCSITASNRDCAPASLACTADEGRGTASLYHHLPLTPVPNGTSEGGCAALLGEHDIHEAFVFPTPAVVHGVREGWSLLGSKCPAKGAAVGSFLPFPSRDTHRMVHTDNGPSPYPLHNPIYASLAKDGAARIPPREWHLRSTGSPAVEAAGSGGAVRSSRGHVAFDLGEEVEEAVLGYLGEGAVMAGYKVLTVSGESTADQYVASHWHHDRVGKRLKLFIFLGDSGAPCGRGVTTEVSVGTHRLQYFRTETFESSRFRDAWVRRNFEVLEGCGPQHAAFIFDTHTIHRAQQWGSGERSALVVEFHTMHKQAMGRGLPLPIPSGDQHVVNRALWKWRYLPYDVIPPIPPGALVRPDGTGVCKYLGMLHAMDFDTGACGGVTHGDFYLLLRTAPGPTVPPSPPPPLDQLVQHLTDEDRAKIENVTGTPVSELVEAVKREGEAFVTEVLSTARFVPSPLNRLGLHLLRCVLAERLTDVRRREKGLHHHPDYVTWMRDGILVKEYPFDGVRETLRMMIGYEVQHTVAFTPRVVRHVREDTQYQLHVDSFQPLVKMWVYERDTTLANGTLAYIPGSHRNTLDKLRWLFDVSSSNTTQHHVAEASPRLWGNPERYGLPPVEQLLPVPSFNRTLIFADTSGLHHRGWAPPGTLRRTLRPVGGENDGGVRRRNPFFDRFEDCTRG